MFRYLMRQKGRIRYTLGQRVTLKMRLRQVLRQRVVIYGVTSTVIFCLFFVDLNLQTAEKAHAGSDETLSSGAFIINMGVTPQTYANGLKPYGMLYDLVYNYNVPVKWIINTTKAKDGTDFTYSGTAYKGGPFIIRAEDITAAISARITYWLGQGVVGTYTTDIITVPVYTTITYFPKAMIDDISGNDNIIKQYYTNAALPAAAYQVGSPSALAACHDIWVNPHGDPTWATHSYLYNFSTVNKSFIWSQCHAVSAMEGATNTSSPFEQLNFLSTTGLKCYGASKCGAGITQSHAGGATGPFTHNYPTDPVMQFMGTMDGATDAGSERWYIPQTTGAWRGTTKRLVTSSDGTSPGEGVVMVYGPAYGNSSNGYVMYEGGHDLDHGTTPEKVAAMRAFFNFVLLSGIAKQLVLVSYSIPASSLGSVTTQVFVKVSAGTPPYTYAWTSTVGGSFANASADTTTFTSAPVGSTTTGVLKCVITDACGRKQIVSNIITINTGTPLPISLLSFSAKEINGSVKLDWETASELNNDYFTLTRSTDFHTFTEIARINGAGSSTDTRSYTFLDEHPLPGNNYYGLSQTDYDGTTKLEDVKMVNIQEDGGEISVYPNPFRENIKIRFGNSVSPAYITLTSGEGKLIYANEIIIEGKRFEFSIAALEEISSGLYFLSVSQDDKKLTWRLYKR